MHLNDFIDKNLLIESQNNLKSIFYQKMHANEDMSIPDEPDKSHNMIYVLNLDNQP